MSLGEVIDGVIEATGRPDKENYIRGSVSAIIRMVASLKDDPLTLVDEPQTVSISTLVHTVDLTSLAKSFRRIAYIRSTASARFLTNIHPLRAMQDGMPVVNCFYQRGTDLIINLAQGNESTTLVFGYYAHPETLTNDAATNWVLDDYQDVVMDFMIAKVLRLAGDAKGAKDIESGMSIRLQQIIEGSATNNAVMGQ